MIRHNEVGVKLHSLCVLFCEHEQRSNSVVLRAARTLESATGKQEYFENLSLTAIPKF